MMLYLIIKTIHIAAVVLFIGNIFTGNFWKEHGDRSGDNKIMAEMMDGIIRSDRLFTIPGVVIIIITGIALAVMGGFPILGTFWIWTSLALFGISGICFSVWVAPLQYKIHAVVLDGVKTGILDQKRYNKLSRWWTFWGLISLLAVIIAMALMVLKPSLTDLQF